MYSNKENINILTALLVAYGVKHVVVCPGSRNAPLVHNFSECPDITCHPVTDERSAGFVALGLSLSTDTPVAVCVTSGSAMLNVAPAVAEASYQHRGIIVITADRPQAWIGQLDGQTIPQPDAFGGFAEKSVSLPEPHDDEQRWYCRRLVCEAMITWQQAHHPSVHINVPISEPLFEFTVSELPKVKPVILIDNMKMVIDDFAKAKRPMLVVGQITNDISLNAYALYALSEYVPVLKEQLSSSDTLAQTDLALYSIGDETADYEPDYIIYIGGNTVSKRLRRFLRKVKDATVVMATERAVLEDITANADVVMRVKSCFAFLDELKEHIASDKSRRKHPATQFASRWNALFYECRERAGSYVPRYSQVLAVKVFEELVRDDFDANVFYGNSTAVRLGDIFSEHYIYCNRGINGIEGSLSTAVGFSLATDARTYCVIGDLSFFYDQNALWNTQLKGNLRIILINNGGGGIFRQLKGLSESPAMEEMVMASHQTSAQAVCLQHNMHYVCATDEASLREGLGWLTTADLDRPALIEVITDSAVDAEEYKALYEEVKVL